MKKIAILQSCYIPWKGYFDLINSVDEFILFDEVQYTKRDWRNRNLIKTPKGLTWLTIPVKTKGKYYQAISETTILQSDWAKKHWDLIQHMYKKAPFFNLYSEIFSDFYLNVKEDNLSNINHSLIFLINKILGIKTIISRSTDYISDGRKTEKLVKICLSAKANIYLSGPSAKVYLNEEVFKQNNIQVEWMSYSNYPVYEQLYPPFEHNVSILDLLFHTGGNAKKYMNSSI